MELPPKPEMQISDWLEGLYNPPPSGDVVYRDYVKELVAYRNSEEDRLKAIINIAAERQRQDYDFMFACTGQEGSGKSNLINQMCKLDARQFGLSFSYEYNVIYNPTWQGVMQTMLHVPQFSAVNIDEAIRTMYTRNWNARQQREMNTLFATIRKKNLFVGLAIPALGELDSFFKNFRIAMWIHIFEKGKAGVFVKDPNPFNTDPFNLRLAKRIIDEKMPNRFSVEDMIRTLYEDVPNFITWFKFPPPSPKDKAEYLKNWQKYQIEMPKEQEAKKSELEELKKVTILTLFESSDKWTVSKLSEKFGISEYKIRQYINKEREAKLKEAEKPREAE